MGEALPSGFEDLEPLVGYWSGVDVQERWDRRARASMEDISAFYHAMLPRAEAALAYLQPKPLDGLNDADSRLYRLVLSLAHAAMAVELHGQPRAAFSPFPHAIRVTRGPAPFD
jgi:hypothetical protein